jgi:hypothetical protein
MLLVQVTPAAVSISVTPSAISNAYTGNITMMVTGLSPGGTVVVQKFLDANTNGIIDASDSLWQQFQLTDGQAHIIGGVTNTTFLGDLDAVSGQITARWTLQSLDIAQQLAASYLFRTAVGSSSFTNAFAITNTPYAQTLTGSVLNHGTNIPNALVVMITASPTNSDSGMALLGGVANNSGNYSLRVPTGTFDLAAVKSGFLGNLHASRITVTTAGTVNTNLVLTDAPVTISGKLVDETDTAIGVPGIFLIARQPGSFIGIGNSASNGDFVIRVGPGLWEMGENDVEVPGYVELSLDDSQINTTTGSVSGLILKHPKATALFYGSIKDEKNLPLSGINLNASDNNNKYHVNATSDSSGNFVVGVRGGEEWGLNIESDEGNATNYLFSGGAYTNLNIGQAVLCNFTAIRGTNRITGHVQDNHNLPLFSVRVYTFATIGGQSYETDTQTDTNGNYSLNVVNGNWTVDVCCSCDDWPQDLCCPTNHTVIIAGSNGVANFSGAGQILITTSSPLPEGQVNIDYSNHLEAVTCVPNAYWFSTNTLPGLDLSSDGVLSGTPYAAGSNYIFVQVQDFSGNYATKYFSLIIQPDINAGVAEYYINKIRGYRQTNGASAFLDNAQGPYSAVLGIFQDDLGVVTNAKCTLPTLSIKTFPGPFSAYELQTVATFTSQSLLDAAYPVGNYAFEMHSRNDGVHFSSLNLPLSSYPPAPHLLNFAAAQALDSLNDFTLTFDPFTGASPDDYVYLVITQTNTPLGFKSEPDLYPDTIFLPMDSTATEATIEAGTLQPQRTYLGALQFIRMINFNDTNYSFGQVFNSAQTLFTFSTTAAPRPGISAPSRLSATEFSFQLSCIVGQQYTIEKSTTLNPPDWSALLVTNAPVSPILVLDSSATNTRAYYRARLDL